VTPASVPDRPAHSPVKSDQHRLSGAQPGDADPAPGGLVTAEACTGAAGYCVGPEPRPPPEPVSGLGPVLVPGRPATASAQN
jgi:hypothetical protein